MHTYLPKYAYVHSSLIFGARKTNAANETHAETKHAESKRDEAAAIHSS